MHLGKGDWITVDSCKDQPSGEHPLLAYFAEIGVDVSTQVHRVVGTHAHDDHVAGIADLFAAAKSARFVSSSAVTSREFFASVRADENIEAEIAQSVRSEYRGVFTEVRRRGRRRTADKPMMRAVEQLPIWTRAGSSGAPHALVLALSPSHHAVTRALDRLAEGTAKAGQRRKLSGGDPNEFAVALWVEVGDLAVLLGADLLNGPSGCGWEAVMGWHSPVGRASVLKVPHHGSPNAHYDPMWSGLLTDDVVSLVAPYRGSQTPRPSPSDMARICALSSSAWSTASTKLPAPTKAVRSTRAAMVEVAKNVREPYGQVGQARARWSADRAAWDIVTFPPARRLPST